jgi:hypothetical protein
MNLAGLKDADKSGNFSSDFFKLYAHPAFVFMQSKQEKRENPNLDKPEKTNNK